MILPLADGKYRRIGRLFVGLLGFSALAIWAFHFYLWYQYDGAAPLQPDVSSGRLHPLNTHGHVVYLTKNEDGRLAGLTILTFFLFGIAFLINAFFVEGFSNKKMPWEKKQW